VGVKEAALVLVRVAGEKAEVGEEPNLEGKVEVVKVEGVPVGLREVVRAVVREVEALAAEMEVVELAEEKEAGMEEAVKEEEEKVEGAWVVVTAAAV